jgi:hypothetical protein
MEERPLSVGARCELPLPCSAVRGVRFDSASGNIQVSHFAPPLLRGGIPVCAYPLSLLSGSNARSTVVVWSNVKVLGPGLVPSNVT